MLNLVLSNAYIQSEFPFFLFWVKKMSILDLISNKEEWLKFQEYKVLKGHLTKKEQKELEEFISKEKYKSISLVIKDKEFNFNAPVKKIINKMGTDKKRIVYCYNEIESMILKFITYHLFKYDDKMCDNCFSFRKNYGVKKAIGRIVNHRNIKNMACYKVDIKNYFNSININKLMVMLKEIIDDKQLFVFMEKLLVLDKANFDGKIIEEKRGAMAGVPFSPFLANIYLKDLDKYFDDNNILYARYSDDIIVFADTLEELEKYKNYINKVIKEKDLLINKEKEFIFNKGEVWNFLGIEYDNGEVDLSKVTIEKIKGKIRRKARAIYRWKIRKAADNDKAMRVMTRCFNNKFFDARDSSDLTWSKWFFPLINTDRGLNVVDEYLQQYLRYICTGKHTKANYRIRYKQIKDCNYRSLVNEFYKFKKEGPYV